MTLGFDELLDELQDKNEDGDELMMEIEEPMRCFVARALELLGGVDQFGEHEGGDAGLCHTKEPCQAAL